MMKRNSKDETISTMETIGKFYSDGMIDEDTAVRLLDSRNHRANVEAEIEYLNGQANKYNEFVRGIK